MTTRTTENDDPYGDDVVTDTRPSWDQAEHGRVMDQFRVSLDAHEAEAKQDRADAIARHRPAAIKEVNELLALNHKSNDPNDWPEWKRPETEEYETRVDRAAERRVRIEEWDARPKPLQLLHPYVQADLDGLEVQAIQDTDGHVSKRLPAPHRTVDLDDRVEVQIEPTMRAVASEHASKHEAGVDPLCDECERREWGVENSDDSVQQLIRRRVEDRVRRWLTLRRAIPTDVRPREPERPDRLTRGSAFLAVAEDSEQIWGGLWQSGEALLIAGPPGIGKTTVAQQVLGQLIDDQPGTVLGQQVACFDLVVYLAMDRPQQIARSLRRTLADVDPEILDDRLVVWQGPPPEDVAARPESLLELVMRAAGGDLAGRQVALIVDSLKDAAVGLVDDAVGASYNRARQLVLAAGIEVLELHHLVKRGANGTKPTTLADVYGSAWITAGAGSVVLLWGEAGDPLIELRHLKSPAGEVGPLRVAVDHAAGTTSLVEGADLLAMLRARPDGMSAKAAGVALFSVEKATPAQVEKARRRLEALVSAGHAYRHDPPPGSRDATVWTALTNLTGSSRRPSSEEAAR